MTDHSLEIAPPDESAAREVMGWRQAADARSTLPPPPGWERFWPEFRAAWRSHPDLPPLFLRAEGARVAFVTARPAAHPAGARGRTAALTLDLAPGRAGAAVPALEAAARHLAGAGIDTLLADPAPPAALAEAFAAAGFRPEADALLRDLTPRFFRTGRVRVIAEAGSNWRMGTPPRDRAMARALIDVAVEAGADCVKFQTYRPETVYVATAGSSDYLSEAGIREDIRDIFADLAMPYEMVAELAEYAAAQGIAFMSTPFSPEDFAAIDPHTTIHKIASYEISHPHLLRLAAESGKPLVLSTGASVEADISWAVETFRAAGGRDLCLLQCTAKYPAPIDAMNLRTIPWLRARFAAAAGLSDHSRDPRVAPMAAVALGADVIEKHYTLDNRLPGPDHAFALEPEELEAMVAGIRAVEQTLGDGVKTVLGAEEELAAYARRGVQTLRPVAAGETFAEGENVAVLRPGKQPLGVHPRHLGAIEGARATRDLGLGEGVGPGDWAGA